MMTNKISPEQSDQSSKREVSESILGLDGCNENLAEEGNLFVTSAINKQQLSFDQGKTTVLENEEINDKNDSECSDSDDEIVPRRKSVMVTKKLIIESEDESNDIGGADDSNHSSNSNSYTPQRERGLNDGESFEKGFTSFNENLLQHEDGELKQRPKEKKKLVSKKEKAPSRKAKELALAEIHSETQRMIRERRISLPYHQPKQRTLADFMSRRKLAPTSSLKTSSDNLAKVLKHVEEREKAAEIFYGLENSTDGVVTNTSTNTVIEINETKEDSKRSSAVSIDPLEACRSPSGVGQSCEDKEFPQIRLSGMTSTTGEMVNNDNYGKEGISQQTEESFNDSVTLLEQSTLSFQENIHSDVLENIAEEASSSMQQNSEVISESIPAQCSEDTSQSCVSEDSFSLSNFRKKIDALNLPITKFPKITGDPDDSIDLDELSTKPGALGLMRRFLKHAKLKPRVKKEETVLSIISSEVNECLEVIKICKDTVKLSAHKDEESKPGEKLVVLKSTLQQQIAVNREKQLAKKMEEYKLYEEEFYGALKADDESDHLLSEEDEEIEYDVEKKQKNYKINNCFISEEAAEDEDDEESEEDDLEENAEDEEKSVADIDSDDDDRSDKVSTINSDNEEDETSTVILSDKEDDEHISPPLRPIALHSLAGTQDVGSMDESQLMALCSGTFSNNGVDLKKLESPFELDDDVSMGASESKHNESENEGNISIDENDKDESDEEVIAVRKSGGRKLSFSDHEDTVDEHPEGQSDSDGDVNENDDTEKYLDDKIGTIDEFEDDEEDEEIQLAKKYTKGFLEREAELSGSEWGSEDEEEKEMDAYEREEGDDERINQRRLQKELGKIHAREMMAEDSREIKILQELLLEDGELHSDGPKRQRLFRWANQGDDNFGDKTSHRNEEDSANDDEEDEDSWRKDRLERENYLRNKKIDNLELDDPDCSVPLLPCTNKKLVTKIQPQTCSAPTIDPKPVFKMSVKRGSFLNRGEKMLSKLAEITNYAGSTDKATTNSRNNRNMVFSVISPSKDKPEEEAIGTVPVKRKTNLFSTSIAKKIKTDKCDSSIKLSVLEQLKALEST